LLSGSFAERIKRSIDIFDDGTASFRLDQNERCHFLNPEGLCDMILELGEDALCQICTDHPRFRHYFSDRTEIGLGLCCEAAGNLILNWPSLVSFRTIFDDGNKEAVSDSEQEFDELREEILSLVQNRGYPFEIRIQQLLSLTGCGMEALEQDDWVSFLLSLERMEDAWAERLETLKTEKKKHHFSFDTGKWENTWEQLMVYLIYRHLPGVLDDGDWKTRVNYCILICKWLSCLWNCQAEKTGESSMEELIELARLYSCEIEYSDENVDAILERIRLLCGSTEA